jgi:hypothetical protein
MPGTAGLKTELADQLSVQNLVGRRPPLRTSCLLEGLTMASAYAGVLQSRSRSTERMLVTCTVSAWDSTVGDRYEIKKAQRRPRCQQVMLQRACWRIDGRERHAFSHELAARSGSTEAGLHLFNRPVEDIGLGQVPEDALLLCCDGVAYLYAMQCVALLLTPVTTVGRK